MPSKQFSSLDDGFVTVCGKYIYKSLLPVLIGKKKVLEIGCADGNITRFLINHDIKLTCIDPDQKLLDNLPPTEIYCLDKLNHKGMVINKVCCKFEDWNKEFSKEINDVGFYESIKIKKQMEHDFIICSLVLEHVEDINIFMKQIQNCCHDKTVVYFVVPNAFSYHRQGADSINMIKQIDSFSEKDKQVGHKHYFNPYSFRKVLNRYFNITNFGGIMFKPLPDYDMINCDFSANKRDLYEMYFNVGQYHPTECSLLTATCMLKES